MKKGYFNCRVKCFKSSEGKIVPYELMAFNKPVFGPSSGGFEKELKTNDCSFSDNLECSENSESRNFLAESKKRAIRKCRDIGICNPDLSLFATFTLDPDKIDRYDYDVIVKKLNVWLDNRVRRNGLKYLLVPEYHKDGAIHFHALINDVLERKFSGVFHKGKKVWNLPAWSYGFTDCVRIVGKDCAKKVTEYVLKYITKSDDKVGGRFYFHGGDLATPLEYFFDIDIDTVEGKAFEVSAGVEVKVCRNELTISELSTKSIKKWGAVAHEGRLYNAEGVESSIYSDVL